MNSRRSFFKRCATAIAVLALAPQIAFSRQLETLAVSALDLDEIFRLCCVIYKSRQEPENPPPGSLYWNTDNGSMWTADAGSKWVLLAQSDDPEDYARQRIGKWEHA